VLVVHTGNQGARHANMVVDVVNFEGQLTRNPSKDKGRVSYEELEGIIKNGLRFSLESFQHTALDVR